MDQDTLLDRGDFDALWRCLAEGDALGFYNGGKIAGASQPHKHLQVVPLPLAEEGTRIPIEPRLRQHELPFAHRVAWLDPADVDSDRVAEVTAETYRRLLHETRVLDTPESRTPRPYNLLVTREWMMLVPRSREHFESMSVNSLGFAGALLVRDRDQLERLEKVGPLTALRRVVGSPGARPL